ncbi:secretion protein : Efflux transporter, RND family, MFP subunit OS=uncultured planctomycete GN=HGMM_F01A04C20 PE=4 SV=1: Biotin_lipoyl_2: HlyD_3: HlyD_2 [Gemmata massiliana]|uniref:RND efflux pump membrane fusion protein barrel-sandwich domain-containing protein n=1 Tax=Gemmata massiliana TaxID=1210884 RepID=A0A6P2D4H1_9BACT|nr:efflux RND transporter periplasmic adaptor subunit [Gemmata massiliana]VTR95386.1 secretion protein : Efflux transporter, RND family, MFP subunit OS=uncultured planctomycete GN=HGMM_F01A04C20 PE=4 SV=1: Biotin_lipoyl_2: HlyD_3: HlyD_2 [Gemmata massiliana]
MRTTPGTRLPHRTALLAVGGLLTIGAAVLIAHEGHAPLPTRGAQVDAEKGTLLLTADARAGADVDTAPVEQSAIEERVPAYASLVAPWPNQAFATARVPGRVVRVAVTPGQRIAVGDTIAEIESLEIDTLQLDVLAARTDIALAEKQVAELTKSADAGAVAGQMVIDAQTRLARNRNALDLARGKWLGLGLPAARLDELLRRGEVLPGLALPVTAPVSGTVARADLTTGKVVEPAEQLAEVIDLSTVWVRIEVLEKDLRRIAVGQLVELHLAAYPGEVFRTTVRARSQYLDATTNVTTAWAELANPSGSEPRFRPGMSGQAHLVVTDEAPVPSASANRPPSRKHRLTVPATAILREGVERFVLVEEANAVGSSEYRKVPVVVGRAAGGRVEVIAGGVFAGDRVVTRGGHELGPFFAPTVLRPTPEAARNIGLRVEPARVVALDEIRTLDGAVDVPPAHRGFAASQLAGTIHSIKTDRGRSVTAGEVLGEVFSPELLTMQQELLRIHLEVALAVDRLDRLRSAGVGVAATRVWEQESQVKTLKAQADALRRKLLTVGLISTQIDQLLADKRPVGFAPVRAPFAGVVVNFDKVLGQAAAAHESLFEVRDPAARAPIRGFVPERDTDRIKPGQVVRARLIADPNFVGRGVVARSGGTFGAENRTQSIWVDLDTGSAPALLHGQLATLSIVLGQRPLALAVPRSSVATEGTAAFVFVQKTDGTLDRRPVEIGPTDDRFVTITRGLADGEPVAVAGVNELMTAFSSLR